MEEFRADKAKIAQKIVAQKAFYKFRQFMYSLNREIRQHCFGITRAYLENACGPFSDVTVTERNLLIPLLQHWDWTAFDTAATAWWTALSTTHYASLTLMEVINRWIDDIQPFDADRFETGTDGLR